MSLILKFLSGPLGTYVLIAVAVALFGSMGYAALQHQRAERYQTEAKAAQDEAGRLLVSVKSKDDVIAQQRSALEDWRRKAQDSAQASAEAGNRAEQFEQDLHRLRGQLNSLSEADRELPECQVLLRTDLDAACPGNSGRVRQWSADRVPGSGGNDHDPGEAGD